MTQDKYNTTTMTPLFGEGEDWEYQTTIDEAAAKDIEQTEVTKPIEYTKSTNTLAQSQVFPDNVLIINDVFLYGIPTTAIKIEKPTDVFVGETLRTASPNIHSTGRQTPALYLSLLFNSQEDHLKKLHRIISVLRRHPFAFIHNNKIAREVGIHEFETTIFALETGTLRSVEGAVGVIALDLSFKLFNYKPFSNHHWYSGRLFKETPLSEDSDISNVEQNPLDSKGYSTDQHSVSIATEEQRTSVTKKAIEDSYSGDVPVALPSESAAWMLYADRLSSAELTPPIISDFSSDFVGISVRKFEYISPPGSARAGKGDVGYWYNNDNSDLKPHVYPWRKTNSEILQTSQERYIEAVIETSNTSQILDSDALATYYVPGRKKTLQIDSNTALWLGRMVCGENTDPSAIPALLWTIVNRFFFWWKGNNLVELITQFSTAVNIRYIEGGYLYEKRKAQGDLSATKARSNRRIKNRSRQWKDMPKHVRNMVNRFRQGTLPYPSAFSSRPKSKMTNWGSQGDPYLLKNFNVTSEDYVNLAGEKFFEDAGTPSGTVKITPPKNSSSELAQPNEMDMSTAEKVIRDKKEKLKQTQDNTEERRRATDNLVKATAEARAGWIANKANNEKKFYYDEDPNVRNIFYETQELLISGDFRQQQNLSVAPGIVCSAISVSFGHRLAPIRLAGQSTSTFQFLGAGNRSGQMVFTFAGKDGEDSADQFKAIIESARQNAQYYSHEIPEAGSVKLSHYNPGSGEQNIILALLGIEDVVITNTELSTVPDSTDTSQFVVEFIAQEFGKERFDRKFLNSLDSKKKIIRGIMDKVTYRQETNSDKRIFRPDKNVAIINQGEGRKFVVTNAPSWFASLVAKAADICTEVNEELPPITWRRGEQTSETWEKAWADWGAGGKIVGRVGNISTLDFIPSGPQEMIEYLSSSKWEETFREIKKNNGGSHTNDVHVEQFNKWLTKMNSLATEAQQYIKDEENFEKYFGSLGSEILDTITTSLNECYDDMQLPNVPGTEVRLPPEFYIFDDSDEDPTVAEATSKENLEILLQQHVDNEIASIRHIMQDAWLGGSYISKNLPKILETRQAREVNTNAELTYFSNWFNLFIEGGQPWDPITNRYLDPSIERSAENSTWFNFMRNQMGAKTDEEMRFKYIDNLTRLSGYLNDNRHWASYDAGDSRQEIIESVYGEAYNNITFGPDPTYANVDSAVLGIAESESTLNARRIKEEQEAVQRLGGNKTATTELGGARTVRGDGVVTVGNPQEEEETLGQAIIRSLPEVDTLRAVGSFLMPSTFGVVDKIIEGIDQISTGFNRFFSTLENIIIMKHPLLNKIKEEESSKNIATIGSSVAFGTKRNDISMRRAYPTFRIYFIEDDSEDNELYGKTFIRAFDDFYSYSAIQEIRIHRSRKIAADLAIVRMTNVTGKLFRRRFGQRDQIEEELNEQEKQGIFAETNKEHPFEKLVLQDGVKVQIRLGMAPNPDDLETVFLGQIVEVAPAEDGKIIEIIIQGYGAELESIQLGSFEDGPVFYSTQQVLSGAIIQDSIVNFGRRSKFNRYNPAEIRNAWTGGSGIGGFASLSPGHLIENWSNKQMDRQLSKYTFLNYPQDDNIYAPDPEIYSTWYERAWNNACSYRPLNQTPWQIFKEHELRHPGYCALAVPYGHSPRMTMFFGAKSQHYWSRPPSPLEIYMSENNYNTMIKLRQTRVGSAQDAIALNSKFKELEATSPALAQALIADLFSTSKPNAINIELGKQFGRYIPFRNYHYFDDKHHIIKNEIRTSVDGTFNEVSVVYFDNENTLEEDEALTDAIKARLEAKAAESESVLSVKLDENIPEQFLRSYKESFPSCVTLEMARRYASGLFARHLKDTYKGELVVIGDPSIKPYSICFINDQSIDMAGPIEVESVTHIFSRDTGFISIITPDMCVDVNDMFSASVFDVAASASSLLWGNTNPLSPIGSGWTTLALMAGVKIANWTQDGDPVVSTPLTLAGRPFVSATIGHNDADIITQIHGKWRQYWDDLGDAWDKLDVGEAIFDTKTGIKESLFDTFGTGFNSGIKPVGE